MTDHIQIHATKKEFNFTIKELDKLKNPCEIHSEKEKLIYCFRCERFFCLECIFKDHHGHYALVNEDIHRKYYLDYKEIC